ncbi:MAG: FAD-dependent oxidoreductase [Phycisphaeraceae bacterium]
MLSKHPPYWAEHAACRHQEPLVGEARADVVVVGAGITGLTAAMRLLRAGRSVTVLEAHRVGAGTTGHSTGHLDAHNDHSFQDLVARIGIDNARKVVDARREAIEHIASWENALKLDADFERLPAYWYTERDEARDWFGIEAELARKLGLEASVTETVPLPFRTGPGMRLGNQARFSPLKYLCNLARTFTEAGGKIYENVRAIDVQPDGSSSRIRTADGAVITAHEVILATHLPWTGFFSLQSRVYPYQSYAMAVKVADPVPDALFWDNADPYHYTRLADTNDPTTLIIGGADHHTGDQHGDQAYADLERYILQRYDVVAITHRWSSEYYETADTLPFIGRVPSQPRLYIGTGYSGTGLTWGTFAGIMLSELAVGNTHRCEQLLSPSRFQPRNSFSRMATELAHIAEHLVGDRVGPGEVELVDDIPPGQGRIMLIRGRRLAVYRDEVGKVHAHSATCTHAGCIVHWNNAESTWDCPCHGGRYDPFGRVLNGPPREPLAGTRAQEQTRVRSVP